MLYGLRNQFSKLLQYLAEALDISESRYKQAEERYQAVGKWLGRDESVLAPYTPEIYPQGSFRLGTVIKPISDAEEYDIDLVCEVKLTKDRVRQKRLKEAVGQEMRGYTQANNMNSRPEEGRRCWMLNYADGAQFHMDILPALPDGNSFKLLLESKGYSNDWSDLAIAITDNTLPNYDRLDPDWPQSNSRGYAEWFKGRMVTQFEAQRKILAEAVHANIEDIPEYRVKTPLQRAVQILKRHRDIMFAKDQDHKPISIIITTLAAHAYRNEGDLLEALINIVNGMPLYIQKVGAVSWVANPVNPLENFADKWQEHPQREQNFRRWLQQVQNDLNAALQSADIRAFGELLEPSLGEKVINETLQKFPNTNKPKLPAAFIGRAGLPSRFSVSHRQAPIWPVLRRYSVTITGNYSQNGHWQRFESDSRPLPKRIDLLYIAETDVPQPFDVFWQVVNTGLEATTGKGLRGTIFPAKIFGVGGLRQKESTLYKGMHWIECFIVKDGVCLARSGEFVVNIQ
jgi:hypothetical protein